MIPPLETARGSLTVEGFMVLHRITLLHPGTAA